MQKISSQGWSTPSHPEHHLAAKKRIIEVQAFATGRLQVGLKRRCESSRKFVKFDEQSPKFRETQPRLTSGSAKNFRANLPSVTIFAKKSPSHVLISGFAKLFAKIFHTFAKIQSITICLSYCHQKLTSGSKFSKRPGFDSIFN